jgi:signal transduction histidine kinase
MHGGLSLPLKKGNSIATRIGLLVAIEISLVIGSFVMLAYFESQSALIGNSINIAGKNRFLTSVVVLQADKYFMGHLEISKLNEAINQLDYNIDTLRVGGTIAGHELEPLPSGYLPSWEVINERRQELKDSINEEIKSYVLGPIDQSTFIAKIEDAGGNLIAASDNLVGQLGNGAKEKSESQVQMQISLLVINVGFHFLMLYLIIRTIRPVIAITKATNEIKNGNFNVAILPGNGRDEISNLAYSFNEMVERLKKYDRMQKEFIGIASHQLKRPIQPILGYAQLSKEGYIAQQEALDGILQLAKELQQIANDMLDMSRIESGILNYNMKKINIYELVRDIVSSTRSNPLMNANVAIGLVLENENCKGLCIEADRPRMGHALANIVNNAIKFTVGGKITITLNAIQDLGKVRIEISDTGIGIDPEVLPKLFTKFTSKSETGTGLGLYISKEIITAHGGQISAANNERGGATFTIYLPISHTTTNFG